MAEDTGIGGAIGTMIGLGIGVVVAKKLVDTVKEETKDKKPKKPKKATQVAKDWVSQEVGVWD